MVNHFNLILAIVAISSASPHRQNDFSTSGSDENDDDLIHPPWWHPKPGRAPGPGRGFGPFFPFRPDGSRNGGGAGPWHRFDAYFLVSLTLLLRRGVHHRIFHSEKCEYFVLSTGKEKTRMY